MNRTPPTYAARVPASIQTPDSVETRLGTLRFFDGLPDEATVQKVYDNLDFVRGIEAFMAGMPAASMQAMFQGLAEAGVKKNEVIGIHEQLADARGLYLTANSTTVYVWMWADLKDGPVVMEVPPNVLGPINDACFRYVVDVGLGGPDDGKGGNVTLYVDGKPDGKGRCEATVPIAFSLDETCDVGRETATPVSPDYGPHDNEFSGEVNWVQIDLGKDDNDHLISPEERFKLAMVRQ